MRHARLAFLIAATSLLVSGCGGDDPAAPDPPTPEAAVRAAAERLAAAEDGRVVCSRLVTAGFVEAWYGGDRALCARKMVEDDEELGREDVGEVEVTGDRASVAVAVVGGDAEGAGGHQRFVREGTTWKLDDYEDDYVRSMLDVSLEVAGDGEGTGALTHGPLRECVAGRLERTGDAKIRRVMILATTDEPKAMRFFNGVMARCPEELSGYVADTLVDGILEGRDPTPAFVRCMRREVAGLLLATGLAEKALRGNTSGAGTYALAGIASGAQRTCRGKDR